MLLIATKFILLSFQIKGNRKSEKIFAAQAKSLQIRHLQEEKFLSHRLLSCGTNDRWDGYSD
jgi:hypothetical protein